jgi:hypothetical protein
VNPDTGEAETPAHPRAGTWRRDLDWKVGQALLREDREFDIDEEIAAMTPAEMTAALKAVFMAERDRTASRQGTWGARPSNEPRSLMGRLTSGLPISAAQARRHQW